MQVLRTLTDQGVTIIFTTHEPDVAIACARPLPSLDAGRVLDSGPLADLLTAEKLSHTFGVPIRVAIVEGRPAMLLS